MLWNPQAIRLFIFPVEWRGTAQFSSHLLQTYKRQGESLSQPGVKKEGSQISKKGQQFSSIFDLILIYFILIFSKETGLANSLGRWPTFTINLLQTMELAGWELVNTYLREIALL